MAPGSRRAATASVGRRRRGARGTSLEPGPRGLGRAMKSGACVRAFACVRPGVVARARARERVRACSAGPLRLAAAAGCEPRSRAG